MLNLDEMKMLPFKGRGLDEMTKFIGDISQIIRSSKKRKIKILEIGAGYCQVAIDLLTLFPNKLEIYCINKHLHDGSFDLALRVAKHKGITELNTITNKQLKLIYCDAGHHLPFNNQYFDLVISQMAILYVEDKIKLIEEVSRVLKGNGIAFLHTAFTRKIYEGEFRRSLEIVNDSQVIEFPTYAKKFTTISVESKSRGDILIVKGGCLLSFGLKLQKIINLERIDPILFGMKSIYTLA